MYQKNVHSAPTALQKLLFFLWIEVISFLINAKLKTKGEMDYIILKIQDIISEKEECN